LPVPRSARAAEQGFDRRSERVEIRFHSPYRHWLVGLLAELAVFTGFLAVIALIAYVASLAG